jgi:hypothetical protein
LGEAISPIAIDAKERQEHSLDEVIEPEVRRIFGVLVAEDDFSASGEILHEPASVSGAITDMDAVDEALRAGSELLGSCIDSEE